MIDKIKNKIKEMLFEKLRNNPTYDIAREIIVHEQEKEDEIRDYLISLGYTEEIALKITNRFPYLFHLGKEFIIKKFNEIMDLGYSKEETIKITLHFPNIFGLNIDNLKTKIYDMVNLGYSFEDAMEMTKNFPAIFGLTIDNIREKKEFYDSIGLNSILIKNTSSFIKNIELCYARYMFYKSNGIIIDEDNCNLLFISSKTFKKIYNIDDSELIEKYRKMDNSEDNNRKR